VTYRITWQQRDNGQGVDGRVAMLEDGQGSALYVWPALGFNAYRWAVQTDSLHELLYADPDLFGTGKPTRSGIPVLFPFPNRIRAGSYTWNGRTYQLPLTGDGGKTAIHGFACRNAWRVIDEGGDVNSAWLTGEFQISHDAPAAISLWPADARLRLTYRLLQRRVRIEAAVDSANAEPLPFGLGFHPYFTVAPFGGEEAVVLAPAQRYWELEAGLPTGKVPAVDGPRDLRLGVPMAGLQLDDVLTDLPAPPADAASGLGLLGMVRRPPDGPALRLYASADFRELVAFTPPHRQAVCLEPYTCTTDAINLQAKGIDAGWKVVAPGQSWHGVVELVLDTR
jgi:aldose 1-epimerase